MALTPLIMMASESLLASDPVATNPTDPLAIVPLKTSDYETQPIVANYKATQITLETSGNVSASVINNFIHRLDTSAPYISNAGLDDGTGGLTENYSQIVNQHVTNLFPSAQQFVQYAMIAMAQKEQANKYVNSAVNVATCPPTFTTQDALMTGNLAAISTEVQAWGQELLNTGQLINVARLDIIGTPQAIVESLIAANSLAEMSTELESQGIDIISLTKAINENPNRILSPSVQYRIFVALALVVDDQLTNILDLLNIVTPGINSMADLLDLTKIFPSTFATLTAPFDGTLQNIFTVDGNTSSYTNSIDPPIDSVLPDSLAKSNYAFIIALGQIKGILATTTNRIATAAILIKDNTGLPDISAVTETLPASTSAYFVSSMGGGTGPDTTFYLTDLIGAPAGLPYNTNIDIMNAHFVYIESRAGFSRIASVLEVMRGVAQGHYDTYDINDVFDGVEIPAGFPGAGSYASHNSAINALLVELDAEVVTYTAAYPTQHAEMMDAFTVSFDAVVAGIKQLWDAEVRFETTYVPDYQTNDPTLNGLPANKKSTLAFAENLHQYGRKTNKFDIVEILEAMATSTQGGDAIIAAMREGRNIEQLATAGITGDNIISDKPATPESGNIS